MDKVNKMNLPNKISLFRILATPVFLFFLVPGWFGQFLGLAQWGRYAAAAIFVIAAITDMVDGKIARKYNQISELGKFLDPIADKLLVTAALVALIMTDGLSVWVVFIILAREFIVTGFRIVAVGQGVVIAADKWGKIKTVLQIVAIVAILIRDFPVSLIVDIPIGMPLMYVAMVMTIISGFNYVAKNIKVLTSSR
jgi:CDP-diacylglycerol--glycerol-3-phosphate 3-phosphatidyltransferase